jgi:hypothetical protein
MGLLVAGPGFAAGAEDIRTFLMSTGVDLDAVAKVRFRARDDGTQRFEVQISGVPPGTYDVLADSSTAGTVTADASGEGRLRIENQPLPFDPRGVEIEVADRAAKVYFRSVLPESGEKANETIDVRQAFADGGVVVPRASGEASYKSRGGKIRFDVKVKDLPAGTYRLSASNEAVADIIVVEHQDGSTVGRVKLDSRFERKGRLVLTLDPLCEDLALREAVDDETTDLLVLERLGGDKLCF